MNTFAFDLDLAKDASPEVVVMRQADHGGTTIAAQIYDHGQLLYTSPSEAYLCIRLPGGSDYYRTRATWIPGTNNLSVVVDEEYACSVPGRTDTAYFEMHINGSIASTASFTVIVLPSATAGMSEGQRYDDEIAATVRAWLDEHPEATTTVQDDSLTTAKLKDGAVTTAKLADGAVTTDKLGNAAVTTDKLGGASVVAGKIANSAVTTHKIADGAVTRGKLDDGIIADTTVTPEWYGAKADGTTDDTEAIVDAIASGRTVTFKPGATYKVRPITINGLSHVRIDGNGATLKLAYNGSNDATILGFVGCTDVDVRDIRVTTDFGEDRWATDISRLFQTAPYGISLISCTSVRVVRCEASLVKDGISCNDCEGVLVSQCRLRNIGQEPIVTRQSRGVTIEDNDLCWHGGDGILVKAYDQSYFYDISVVGNRLHDPKTLTPTGFGTQVGGGITCNAENVETAELTRGLTISGNHINRCRYGIQLGNIADASVTGNVVRVGTVGGAYVSGSCAYGLTLSPTWAPQEPNTIARVLFASNVGVGGENIFKSYSSGNDVPEDHIVFDGNVAFGTDLATSAMAFNVCNSTVIDNHVTGCVRHGEFRNCVVIGNQMLSPTGTPSTAQTSDCYFREAACVIEGNVIEGTQVYVNCGTFAAIRSNQLRLSRPDGLIVNCPESTSRATIGGNDFNGAMLKTGNIYFVSNPQNVETDLMVGTAQIGDEAVTDAKLAANAVTSGKIADGAVATADLADGAVATAKIADNSVTRQKIASGVFAALTAADIERMF